MKSTLTHVICAIAIIVCSMTPDDAKAQDATSSTPMIDVVWLKDGSRLSGTILRWELSRGMEFKLLTGATMVIPRYEILRVHQQISLGSEEAIASPPSRFPKPYAFKEEGLYHTFSGFLNTSFDGGAGLHYSIGHRFNRLLGAGLGFGYESNDLYQNRNFIPLYAEMRGFMLPQKITPYYAVKIGYGFALKEEGNIQRTQTGGIHFAPELGVRFGGSHVNFFAGAQYKIQTARYETDWGGETFISDTITYKRLELRVGIVF